MPLTSVHDYFGQRITLARTNGLERGWLTDDAVAHAQRFRLGQTLCAQEANLFVGCED